MPFSNNSYGFSTAIVPIDRTSTITIGGTAQVLMPANTLRGGWYIFNNSAGTLYINDTGTASVTSIPVLPGQEYTPPAVVLNAISIFGSALGQSFIAKEWNGSPSASAIVNGGLSSAGQLTSAVSLSTVPSSDYAESDSITWYAIAAGTGYVIADVLRQKIKVTSTVVSNVWINVTQGTLLATNPTPAQIGTNLSSVPPSSLRSSSIDPLNYAETNTIQWFANVNGPGYAIGDFLHQKIKASGATGTTQSVVWFNVTTNTVLTTNPTTATMATDLTLSNPVTSRYTSKKKWFVSPTTGISSITNIAAIRNTNAFPIKLLSLDIYGANNIFATTTTAQIAGLQATLYSASTTVTGGTAVSSTRLISNGFTADATVGITTNYTSVSGGTPFIISTFIVNTPAIGPSTSVSDNSAMVCSPTALQGLIIPAASMVLITGLSIGTVPGTPVLFVTAILTEEL